MIVAWFHTGVINKILGQTIIKFWPFGQNNGAHPRGCKVLHNQHRAFVEFSTSPLQPLPAQPLYNLLNPPARNYSFIDKIPNIGYFYRSSLVIFVPSTKKMNVQHARQSLTAPATHRRMPELHPQYCLH